MRVRPQRGNATPAAHTHRCMHTQLTGLRHACRFCGTRPATQPRVCAARAPATGMAAPVHACVWGKQAHAAAWALTGLSSWRACRRLQAAPLKLCCCSSAAACGDSITWHEGPSSSRAKGTCCASQHGPVHGREGACDCLVPCEWCGTVLQLACALRATVACGCLRAHGTWDRVRTGRRTVCAVIPHASVAHAYVPCLASLIASAPTLACTLA